MLDLLCRLSPSIARKRQRRAIKRWYADGAEERRYAYALSPDAVVLDAGGFEGEFADKIHARYGCQVHVFEPVARYHTLLAQRFRGHPKVTVHPFGLGGRTERVRIAVSGDRSSHAGGGDAGTVEECEIRAYGDWIASAGIARVDLMKVNIEGAEFDLMDHVIATAQLPRIRELQIQFHLFASDAVSRRQRIRAALARTHRPTYDYFFIWENWRLGTETPA